MLKRHEFDAAINKGALPNAIMLFGESHFLIERYARILGRIEDANLLSLYHDEYSLGSAKEHLSQGSLFGDRNVLVVKSEKKLSKSDLDILIALCAKNPENFFLYAYFGTDYKTSHKAFSKKAGGECVRFYHPYFNEAKGIILQEAETLGIRMDHHAAGYLLNSQNGDLALACNELPKLQLLSKPITQKEIDDLVYGLAETTLDTLIQTLLEKRDFKNVLMRLLESGEDEIRILTSLSAFMTQLYLFHTYIKVNGSIDSAAILGYRLPQFLEKQRAELSIKFSPRTYKASLRLLLEMELKMKSGVAHDKNALLLSTLIRLQSHL